ncbi:MAG: type II secretion system protein N [Candidatus Chromulinivorax sp.]
MKQPVWILNSSLLAFIFVSQFLLFTFQRVVPRKVSMAPIKTEDVQESVQQPIDITKIYEQDLFGTYEPPVLSTQSFIDEVIEPMPRPPKVIIPEIPVEKIPAFFPPLDAVLKGVIFVKDDPASCIAIVQLKKTKEERNYQVGDLIDDAQIIKILSNRIIIIRSNGQQETLYLREEDAISDFATEVHSGSQVVEDVSGNKYTINIDEFLKQIHNLGEFIALLDLTTVYKQGKNFGCRIGKIEPDSLGSLLGFLVDDIIVKIDNYDVDTLEHRIAVYDHIIQKHAGDTIEVVIYRGLDTLTLLYGLVDNVSKSVVFGPKQIEQKILEELARQQSDQIKNNQDQVYIQSIKIEDEKINRLENRQNIENQASMIQDQNFDELGVWQNGTKTTSIVYDIVNNEQKINSKNMQAVERLHHVDDYKKRLVQEKDNLTSMLQDMKEKDQKYMKQQLPKNVIFNQVQ